MNSKMKILLLLFAITFWQVAESEYSQSFTSSATFSLTPPEIVVLAVIPSTDHEDMDNNYTGHRWKNGEEILPGAQLAMKEINDHASTLLNGFYLNVIPVRVPSSCNFHEGSVPFIEALTSNRKNLVGVVGYFCSNLARQFSQVIDHEEIIVPQISAFEIQDSDCTACPSHSILPSLKLSVKAAILLMQRLNWNRVAVISNTDLNHKITRGEFLMLAKEYEIDVALSIRASQFTKEMSQNFVQEMLAFGTKVVVAFVSPEEVVELVCSAHHYGLKWPNYAWIFLEIGTKEVVTVSKVCPHFNLTVIRAINNVLFLHSQFETSNSSQTLSSGKNFLAYYDAYLKELKQTSTMLNVTLRSNPYAHVLYDGTWAFALVVSAILKNQNISQTSVNYKRRNIVNAMEQKLHSKVPLDF